MYISQTMYNGQWIWAKIGWALSPSAECLIPEGPCTVPNGGFRL